jgi:hypothetical protein
MDIVADGKAKAVLVVPAQPSPVVQYAAREFQEHVRQATGVRLLIRKENLAEPPANPIYIGPCAALSADQKKVLDQLPANSFIVDARENALFIAGRDGEGGERLPLDDEVSMGTLFGVYDWLDRSLGVRWLWPGPLGTVIPKTSEVSSQEVSLKTVVPQLISSRMRFTGSKVPSVSEEFQSRSLVENNRWMRRHRLAKPVNPMYNHGFANYWQRFGKAHPEYFAMRADGVRAPYDHRDNLVQMCVSNPDLPKQAIADWLQERSPMRPYINACENDRRAIEPSCRCSACVALDDPEAKVSVIPNPWHVESRPAEVIPDWEHISLTDRYATFTLRLLEEGRKHDPSAKVVMMGYSFYSDPPRKTKLNEDVITLVVPPYIYPNPPEHPDRVRKLWDGWKAAGATLAYRPNHTLVGYTQPYIYARQYGDDFKYMYGHGLMATMFDSLTGMWGVQGPNLYMHGRLHDRPDLSVDGVLAEYYSAFGKAEALVKRYFEHWEKISLGLDDALQKEVNGGWAVLAVAGHRIFTPAAYNEGRRILDEAKAVAKDDDAKVRQRIEYLATWLEYARLAAVIMPLHEQLKKSPDNAELKARLIQSRDQLDAFFLKHQEDFLGIDLVSTRQVEGWRSW